MPRNDIQKQGRILMLPVDCIEPSPYQARTAFDEPEIAALAVSILQNGLLQPISVRRVGLHKYQLVAGERRLRACRLAKLDKVPAILADYDDSESAALGLLENLQRSQLDPFDTARGIKEVIRLWGCTQAEAARRLGLSQPALANKLRLLKLAEDTLRALRDGQQPDEALLMDFARSLPTALREDSTPTPARRLALLRETFQGMDVSVEVRGALPEDQAVADAFAEIAVECVTNAVRHGYATRVQFHFFQNDCWRMTVTDNGIPPAGPIREGGGIREMRRRIHRLGGTVGCAAAWPGWEAAWSSTPPPGSALNSLFQRRLSEHG